MAGIEPEPIDDQEGVLCPDCLAPFSISMIFALSPSVRWDPCKESNSLGIYVEKNGFDAGTEAQMMPTYNSIALVTHTG